MAAGVALAQEPTPGAKAVLARQAHYKELQKALGGMVGELRKEAPDKAVITADAVAAKTLVQQLPTWFPKGSGPEAGVKTAAKAEIWTDAAGFDAAVSKAQAETAKLAEVAAGGDVDAIKSQARATGAACNACHEKYRAPSEPKPS
jgi:cytochrome c556